MCNTAVTLHGLNIVMYCDAQITSNFNLFLSLYTYGIFVVLELGVGGAWNIFSSHHFCVVTCKLVFVDITTWDCIH